MTRLAGKRVLITGTGGGQGEAAQRRFAEEGARVVGCDVKAGAAEATAEKLRAEGYDVHGETADLTDPEMARNWVEDGARSLGGIDVLYNNAAGFGFTPFSGMTIDFFRTVMRVEVEIVFNTTSPAWKLMIEDGGGSIINTASAAALRGNASGGAVAHGAAKGAVAAMTIALAAEGAEHGIRVNAISPGFIASPATAVASDEESVRWALARCLIRRPGEPRDIAPVALYLASDESSWTTGQNFVIDGGMTMGFRKP